ncbi:MAG: hypothetical protein KA313_08360 [Pseudarcicella sp.]|nr:hypothetical protein [Pseudarcicella sp.]MBP6411095.1 hypothetical protein [Pseudarcicella sp.]
MVNIRFYNAHFTFLCVIASVPFGLFVFMAICGFNSISDLSLMSDPINKEQYEKSQKKGPLGFTFGFSGVFVCMTVIVLVNNIREDNAFKNDGIIVKGIITDGKEQITKNTRSSNTNSDFSLTVAFETKEGEKIKVTEYVSSEDFKEAIKVCLLS